MKAVGLLFQKRIKLSRKSTMNISKRGVSFSHKLGRFVTINSRGLVTIRLPKTGLSYQINLKKYFQS